MSNEYKFNIGQIVSYKGYENTKFFIVGREQNECYAGVQNYYSCRYFTTYSDDRTRILKLEDKLIRLCEIELEDISKMVDRLNSVSLARAFIQRSKNAEKYMKH